MGRANVYTTLNIYTQLMDASLRVAADRSGEELFGIVQSEGVVSLLIVAPMRDAHLLYISEQASNPTQERLEPSLCWFRTSWGVAS
jgi:hypothetical protein